jgi:hypothetical protein
MDSAYHAWIGQAVVLQVALGAIKVPLRGRVMKDDGETLRMRIGDGWDVDIYKAMILAVEEDAMALIPAPKCIIWGHTRLPPRSCYRTAARMSDWYKAI